MIRYSVIIPHKNIPNLLQRCLDSIPERDDIQIIIVDDNSDTSIVDFNHFPGWNRRNVEFLFTKEGKGAGYARNVGLKRAKGKWLLFADADDFYTNNAWDIFDKYLDEIYDIIYFSVRCVDSDTLNPASRNLKNNIVIDAFLRKEKNSEVRLRYTCWEPWNKIWNKEFVERNNLRFEEIPKGNDAFFVLSGGDKACRIKALNESLYVVTFRPQSISYSITKENLKSSLLLKIRINKFYKSKNLNTLRQSVLYDIKQAYVTFGYKFALYSLWLVIKNRGDLLIFLGDIKGWKRLIKRNLYECKS